MKMFTDDIRGLMDYLEIDKAHVLGLSLGGMIALSFVLEHPLKVNKLVLINTLAKLPDDFDTEEYLQTRIKNLELLKEDPEKSFWNSTRFGFHQQFRRKMKNNPKKKFYGLWSVDDVISYYQTNPATPQDMRNIAASFQTYNAYDRLSEIKHKTLLLTASHDMLVPKAKMFEIYKKMPNSTIEVIQKAGHESPKEKAPEINQKIISFLER
jgi:pimeloyl-ACP methyl ester carboxylesterase